MNAVATLMTVPLFGGLSKSQATSLAATCRFQRIEAGEAIIREGESGYTMFVVLRGRVAVSRENEHGVRILFHELGPGEFFGEMSLLSGSPRTADVFAIRPTQVLVVDREAFLRCVLGSPEVAMRIIGHLCGRIQQSDTARITRQTVRQRLVNALLALADHPKDEISNSELLVLETSKTALGERIVACRETVSRELSLLAKAKVIRMEGKLIIIPKPKLLQELAAGPKDLI